MLAIAWYLLKVMLCCGILFGYYWIALRNKIFHHYNRFYLLISVVLSWMIPILKFDFITKYNEQPEMIKLLTVISSTDEYVIEAPPQAAGSLDIYLFSILIFSSISALFFIRLLYSLFRINLLINRSIIQKWDDIYFIFSNAKGTPFSFFKYIFWNENIKLNSPEGEHILKHELAHVHEKHSADKLFIGVSLIFGWYNPFMWLVKKELYIIHEFIADQKAIKNGDTAAFASMILNAAYSPQTFSLSNPFFYSPLKRRLQMITSSKNPRYTYLRKVAILPVISIVLFFLAFKVKNEKKADSVYLEKKYTVVIDAGHGGVNTGAMGINGITEKDLTLQLATLIKTLNKNENIEVLLTRESDASISHEQRLQFAEGKNADLLISLHLGATPLQKNLKPSLAVIRGAEIFISKNMLYHEENKLLGSIVSKNLENIFGFPAPLKTRKNKINILDANKVCPAILLECGYITNDEDLKLVTSKDKQTKIVEELLKSIEQYFFYKENSTQIKTSIKQGQLQTSTAEMQISNGSFARTSTTLKIDTTKSDQKVTFREAANEAKLVNRLVVVDGIKMTWQDYKKLDLKQDKIKQVNVLKGENAIARFGEKAKDGVIEILTAPTPAVNAIQEPTFDKIFTKVENPPAYKGDLSQYLRSNLKYPAVALNKKAEGNVAIKFIVDEDGNLSNFKSLTSTGYGFEDEAIRVIKNSAPWKPAIQNGRNVVFEVRQEINFVLGNQLGTRQNITPAEFPGGSAAWKKYLEKNLNANVLAINRAPAGKYAAIVVFNVSRNGSVSKIYAESKEGYGTEEEGIRIVTNGPKWVPAKKDGVFVDSQVKQTITFMVTE